MYIHNMTKNIGKFSQHRGFGDTVASVTNALGIKQKEGCGCQKRQEWLNNKLPYQAPNIGYSNTKNKQ